MTAFYGANKTNSSQTVPPVKSGKGEQDGKLRVAYDSFALSAAFDATAPDTVEMMTLPKGAKVVEVICQSDDLSGAGTDGIFDVGISGDPDYFISGVDAGGQAATKRMSDTLSAAGYGAELSADTAVLLTATETTTGTSGNIKLAVIYMLD